MASIVTIGAFDGVHLGHQALIRAACQRADTLRVLSVVYTFDPPPRKHFEDALVLTPVDEKLWRLAALGVDQAVVANFDAAYAAREAQSFLDELARLNPLELWVGPDFRFGRRGEGDVDTLRTRFDVRVLDPVRCKSGAVVSSSYVRDLIRRGRLGEAGALLGWEAGTEPVRRSW